MKYVTTNYYLSKLESNCFPLLIRIFSSLECEDNYCLSLSAKGIFLQHIQSDPLALVNHIKRSNSITEELPCLKTQGKSRKQTHWGGGNDLFLKKNNTTLKGILVAYVRKCHG